MSTTIVTIIILATCVCFTSAELRVYNVTNVTHVIDSSFYFPAVVKARNQLIYVSFPRVNNDTKVKIDWNENQSCEITLPRVAYKSTVVESFGDGRIVIGLVEDNLNASNVGVRFYVVNFRNNCDYKRFNKQFGATILESYETFEIVAYYDSFDVFAKSSLHCKDKNSFCLIRYSKDGNQLGIRNFDFDTSESNFDLETIHPLTEFEPSDGYVYVSKQTSTIRILDSNLKTTKQHKTSGFLITHSILNGDIGFCVDTYDRENSVDCLKIDSRMKIKTRTRLTDANYFGTRRIYNLLDGSSLVVSLSRGRLNGLVKRFGVDGKLSEATLFQYNCESLSTEPQDYFVELKGGLYCFSYACRRGLVTHCTSLQTDDSLPTYLT